MTLPRTEVRDPPVSTAGVIGSPRSAHSSSLSLEIMSELDIRLKPVGFMPVLVEIHLRMGALTG